jgi:hypothetical protein
VHQVGDARAGPNNSAWLLVGSTHDDRLLHSRFVALDSASYPIEVTVSVTRPALGGEAPARVVAALLPPRAIGADVIEVAAVAPAAYGIAAKRERAQAGATPVDPPVHAAHAVVVDSTAAKKACMVPVSCAATTSRIATEPDLPAAHKPAASLAAQGSKATQHGGTAASLSQLQGKSCGMPDASASFAKQRTHERPAASQTSTAVGTEHRRTQQVATGAQQSIKALLPPGAGQVRAQVDLRVNSMLAPCYAAPNQNH